jgi:hypothetical protein
LKHEIVLYGQPERAAFFLPEKGAEGRFVTPQGPGPMFDMSRLCVFIKETLRNTAKEDVMMRKVMIKIGTFLVLGLFLAGCTAHLSPEDQAKLDAAVLKAADAATVSEQNAAESAKYAARTQEGAAKAADRAEAAAKRAEAAAAVAEASAAVAEASAAKAVKAYEMGLRK